MSRISNGNANTRGVILATLKRQGAMIAEELGKELTISQVAVRQHLASLEAEGAVFVTVERRGIGRPTHRYGLTPAGDESFPRRYDDLAVTLLDEFAKWQGEEAVNSLLARRRTRMSTLLRDRLKEKPFPVRLQELARFQSEQGYMAEITHDDSGIVWLVKYNCAICVAARQHPSACCAGDLPMLKELLGEVEIVQEEAILDGDHTCTFRIHDCSQRMQED